MAFEIRWLEDAKKDLDAEVAYVFREFGYHAARKALLRIEAEVNSLSSFPLIGYRYTGVTYRGSEVRRLPMKRVTIFYSVNSEDRVVVILAMWNHYRNPDDILRHLYDLE